MRAKMKRYYHKHITGAPLECYIVAAENLAAAEHLEKVGFARVSTKCLRRHFWDMNHTLSRRAGVGRSPPFAWRDSHPPGSYKR